MPRSDRSSLIGTVNSSDFVNGDISASSTTTGYNTADNPLDADKTYKLILESTNGEYPFPSCEQEFEVTDANAQSDTYQADCWWEDANSSQRTSFGTGYKYSKFKIKSTKGFTVNDVSAKLFYGNEEKNIKIDAVGATREASDIVMPSSVGELDYRVEYNNEVVCTGTLNVVAPVTCSVSPTQENISYNTAVTFSGSAVSPWTGECGFKINGNWKNNDEWQHLTNSSMTYNIKSQTTLSFECKNGDVTNKSCSITLSPNIEPPTLPDGDCVDATIGAEPSTSANISFSTTLGNCETGCTYFVENANGDKKTPETDGTIYNGTNITFSAEKKTGDNTYTLYVKNSKNETASCTIPVNYRVPSYSCPDAITAEPGTQVTVTPVLGSPSYCSGGCDYKITGTGIDDIEGENFTSGSLADKIVDTNNPITGTAVTGGVAKKYSLTLSNAAGSGTACDVTVNYKKPTFTCPGDMEKAVGASITVTPTSVTNCTNGCGYKVTKSSASGTAVIGPGTGYTSGALGNGFTGESTEQTVTYYVTLSNPAGETTCHFDVEYSDDIPVCHCATYCGSGCESNISTGNISNSNFTGCVFFTSATRINVNAADSWTINGWHENIKPSDNGCWNNPTNCANFLANHGITAVDGGYYFRGNGVWVELQTTGTNPCSGGSGGGGSGGGGSGTVNLGTVAGVDNATSISASLVVGTTYTLTLNHRSYATKLRIEHKTGDPISLTYTNCSGGSTTETFDAYDDWYERDIGMNSSDNCTITITTSNGGSVNFNHW